MCLLGHSGPGVSHIGVGQISSYLASLSQVSPRVSVQSVIPLQAVVSFQENFNVRLGLSVYANFLLSLDMC